MEFTYTTKETCSRAIRFDIDEAGIISKVRFEGGCPGNTLGLAAMCEGQNAAALAERLRGIDCRSRGTSCPDQLACAITEALAK